MNTTNPQPTQAALKCAKKIRKDFFVEMLDCDESDESEMVHDLSCSIDSACNLPALTAIALAAQGVVDAVAARKAIAARKGAEITLQEAETVLSGIDNAIETLSATLEKLNHTKP